MMRPNTNAQHPKETFVIDIIDCNYDWIADGVREIAKNNPLVIGKKIAKIYQ